MVSPDLSGPELIREAWKQPPIAVQGLAAVLSAVTLALLVVGTVAVALRVWVRAWLFRDKKIWGWDDTLAVLSLLTFIPACAFIFLACHYGLGRRDADINPVLRARAALYMGYWQMHYAASVNLVKAGIAVALLRLTFQRRYRYPIYAILLSAPLFTFGVVVVLVATCNPLGAQWDLALGPCATHDLMAQLSYLFTAFTVILDFACAVIPYLLLRKMEMKYHIKISLLVVLCFGGIAGVSAVIRLPYLKYYRIEEDQLYYFANIVIWSTVENGIGMIAASLPPIRKLLSVYESTNGDSHQDGGVFAVETIGGTPVSGGGRSGSGSGNGGASTQLSTLSSKRRGSKLSLAGRWNRLDDTNTSREQMV